MNTYVAIDILPTCINTYMGQIGENGLEMQLADSFEIHEVHIFGHYYWNVFNIYGNLLKSLKKVAAQSEEISSIGIDGFGADICCFGTDGQLLSQPLSFLDVIDNKNKTRLQHRMTEAELFEKTGMPNLTFSSLMLLNTMREYGSTSLSVADKILFLQDTLIYLLTGEMITESTVASAGGLMNANSRGLDANILSRMNLTPRNFGTFVYPGMTIGTISEDVRKLTGLPKVPVVAVAEQDVASSVISVPTETNKFAYIFSGRMSAVGIELTKPILKYTALQNKVCNQQGINDRICFHKFLRGLPLLQKGWAEWGVESEAEMTRMVQELPEEASSFVDTELTVFDSASSVNEVVANYCRLTHQVVPEGNGAVARCMMKSLALRYVEEIQRVCNVAEKEVDEIHMMGTSSDNEYFCQLIADAAQKPVCGNRKNAAAEGNVMAQAYAAGVVDNVEELRSLNSRSTTHKWYEPKR